MMKSPIKKKYNKYITNIIKTAYILNITLVCEVIYALLCLIAEAYIELFNHKTIGQF